MRLTLNGFPTTVKAIKLEIGKAQDDALKNAELAVVERLQRLINNLNRRSSKRTRLGNFSNAPGANYSSPMKSADIVVKHNGDKTIIYVDDYVFNLLDQGRKPNQTGRGRRPADPHGGNMLRFPAYTGNLTRPDSITLYRTRVQKHPRWVSVHSVAGFEPRDFYVNILKDLQVRRRKKTSIFEFSGDVDSGVIRYKVEV